MLILIEVVKWLLIEELFNTQGITDSDQDFKELVKKSSENSVAKFCYIKVSKLKVKISKIILQYTFLNLPKFEGIISPFLHLFFIQLVFFFLFGTKWGYQIGNMYEDREKRGFTSFLFFCFLPSYQVMKMKVVLMSLNFPRFYKIPN